MITIGVVSVARSDWGILRPLMVRLRAEPGIKLELIAAGAHRDPAFGTTLDEILADGFTPSSVLDLAPNDDSAVAVAEVIGRATSELAPVYRRLSLDLLIALGDRAEMIGAALAAVPLLIPIVHIGGGAETHGAIDDSFRHAITKLSALHFVETEQHRDVVLRLGEEAWRTTVTGALGLDNLVGFTPLPRAALAKRFGLALDPEHPPLLVTLHPETRATLPPAAQAEELLSALTGDPRPIVFTYPNADAGGRAIIAVIDAFVARNNRAHAVPHLGREGYFSVMAYAAAMVGNSSSGLIEAASFRLPVVNIGARQEGRLAPANVIHAPIERDGIRTAIARATSNEFRAGFASLKNPYGDGHAAERMAEVLRTIDPNDPRLRTKRLG